jgi:hypothetical protein
MTANQKLDTMTIYIVADDAEEAVALAIDEFKSAALTKSHVGFAMPKVIHEDIRLHNGKWMHGFEFSTEFIPGAE